MKRKRALKPLLVGCKRCSTCNFFAGKNNDQCGKCIRLGISSPVKNKKDEPTTSRDVELMISLEEEFRQILL